MTPAPTAQAVICGAGIAGVSTAYYLAVEQGMSNVVRHKVFVPVLARSLQDSTLFRKDELLLLVITRWAILDANNNVEFADAEGNTGVGVYRTKNLLMTTGNQE